MEDAEDVSNNDPMQLRDETDLDTSYFSHEIYVCIVWQGGQLGLSYYDLSSMQIHVLPDIAETDEFVLVKQALHQIHPIVIILNSLHDNRLLSCLKKIASDLNAMYSPTSSEPCRLEFLPNINYNFEVSKRRILALNLPSVPAHFNDHERLLHFSSLISLKSTNMIRSVGGLLKFLEESRVGIELESDTQQVPILGFKTFNLESQIQIDCQTYCALKIFGMEQHPSVFKSGWSSGKEALSLFGILNRCKSSIGSRRLREWFLKPLKDSGKMKQRYDAISFLLNAHNLETVSCLEASLKHIKFLPKILLRMSRAKASIGDWTSLYKTIYHAIYIKNICKTLSRNIEIFVKIVNSFTSDLERCMNLMKKTIDFDESKEKKRFVVQPNVDPDLDEKKRFFNGLPDLMSRVAREEIESLNQDIQQCVVSYLPEIGYLLVINMPEGKSKEDDHTIDGLELKFVTKRQIFYKSPKTTELDNLLGDTQCHILEMEFLIMHNLQTSILGDTQVLMDVMNLSAELDCLIALARCASEFGYKRPMLVEENVLEIKGGRHPLQELCCNPFVPNDTGLGGRHHKIHLITGPNACGKSVYLKQVALIVFMAHIGSFVPAEAAAIGPVDGIFSRIKSTESVSVQMSTFMQDIGQVSQALRSATSCSLVILDEFGKGTRSEDGLSLLTAVLKFWISQGDSRPFGLVSTHFHSIIQQKLLPAGETENLTFDTLCSNNELVFLYQLAPGHTSSSFACHIAAQMGTPSRVTNRGHQVSELLCQYKSVPVEEDDASKKQRLQHENIVASFLSLDLNTTDAKKFLKSELLRKSQSKHHQGPLPKNTEGLGPLQKAPQLSDNCSHVSVSVSGFHEGNPMCEAGKTEPVSANRLSLPKDISTSDPDPKDSSSVSFQDPNNDSSSLKDSDLNESRKNQFLKVSGFLITDRWQEMTGEDESSAERPGQASGETSSLDCSTQLSVETVVDVASKVQDSTVDDEKEVDSPPLSFSPLSKSGWSVASSGSHPLSAGTVTPRSQSRWEGQNFGSSERDKHEVDSSQRDRHAICSSQGDRHDIASSQRDRHAICSSQRDRHAICSSQGDRHDIASGQRDRHYASSTSFGYARDSSSSSAKACNSPSPMNSFWPSQKKKSASRMIQTTLDDPGWLNPTPSRSSLGSQASDAESSPYARTSQTHSQRGDIFSPLESAKSSQSSRMYQPQSQRRDSFLQVDNATSSQSFKTPQSQSQRRDVFPQVDSSKSSPYHGYSQMKSQRKDLLFQRNTSKSLSPYARPSASQSQSQSQRRGLHLQLDMEALKKSLELPGRRQNTLHTSLSSTGKQSISSFSKFLQQSSPESRVSSQLHFPSSKMSSGGQSQTGSHTAKSSLVSSQYTLASQIFSENEQ